MDTSASATAAGSVASVSLWYHTLELPGGVVTPGMFDLRDQVGKLPWPDVRGKRCLDVATYDGFYAFELERRGAAQVVATDIPDHQDWDWPAGARARGGEGLAALAGEKGRGFDVAREALGSRVEKHTVSVYDLTPDELGTFDVVVCGSLLLHLRDPVRALESIRSVCSGWLLSIEAVSLWLSVLVPRRPVAELSRNDLACQWWTVNLAGHRRLAEAAGFEVTDTAGPFAEPFGVSHPVQRNQSNAPAALGVRALRRAFAGGDGVPHAALLARPRPDAPLLNARG